MTAIVEESNWAKVRLVNEYTYPYPSKITINNDMKSAIRFGDEVTLQISNEDFLFLDSGSSTCNQTVSVEAMPKKSKEASPENEKFVKWKIIPKVEKLMGDFVVIEDEFYLSYTGGPDMTTSFAKDALKNGGSYLTACEDGVKVGGSRYQIVWYFAIPGPHPSTHGIL